MFVLAKKAFNDLLSISKVILKSSLCPEKLGHLKKSNEIVVMGNGPSLKNFLEQNGDFLRGKDLLAVNYAVLSNYFDQLKPPYYVAIDPVVFCDEAFCHKLFTPLAEKTMWQLELFVPYNVRKKKLWKSIVANNKLINVHYINTTPIKGSDTVSMRLFKWRMGMPSPRNVLVPSLMAALWMGYDTVYTAGVEHSWHNQLWVDDQNHLMINDSHYYDTSATSYARHGTFTIDRLFHSLSLAFGSYHTINRLATKMDIKIYNVTEGSYIDAFERLKL